MHTKGHLGPNICDRFENKRRNKRRNFIHSVSLGTDPPYQTIIQQFFSAPLVAKKLNKSPQADIKP